jgi:hypothetical protein
MFSTFFQVNRKNDFEPLLEQLESVEARAVAAEIALGEPLTAP